MYRYLIYAVTALIIGGAGYYFHSAGVPELVVSDIANNDRRGNGVSAIEVFSGVYQCDESSGCKNVTKLILAEDTTLDVVAIVDGQDVSLGQGTWGVGQGGALVFILRREDGKNPSSLIAKKINSTKISELTPKKGLFDGMENPVFTRVRENQSSTVDN